MEEGLICEVCGAEPERYLCKFCYENRAEMEHLRGVNEGLKKALSLYGYEALAGKQNDQ